VPAELAAQVESALSDGAEGWEKLLDTLDPGDAMRVRSVVAEVGFVPFSMFFPFRR
jgi:hypothetical protein